MPTGERPQARGRAQAGFGYVWTLIAVAAVGIALAAVGELWSTQAQREREAELLAVGRAYRDALASYHASSRAGVPAYPARLEELLEDRRGPVLRRHLRKLYADPVTGSDGWGLITTPDGRIRGVHSRSAGVPIKTANFGPGEGAFEKAASYTEWRFEHVLAGPLAPQKR